MTLPAEFAIENAPLAGAPGVRLHGELDVATMAVLSDSLDDLIRESEGAFVIDLSQVEFLDSSTLSVLMRARALLGREERDLALVCPAGPIRRVFELAGVSDLFTLFGTREAAAAALRPPAP